MLREYYLMHKDKKVAKYEYNTSMNIVTKVSKIYDIDRVPLNIDKINDRIDKKDLNTWIKSRALPDERIGLRDALSKLNISTQEELLMRSLGLSLSDHYWFNPAHQQLSWNEINFLDHDFSDYVGEILLEDNSMDDTEKNLLSPSGSLGGNLRKQWKSLMETDI